MRKHCQAVVFSAVRQQVLGTLLLHPQKSWYLSQLVRHIGAAPSHLHRELALLTEAGILIRRVEGRQTYFQANPTCPILPELTGLLCKLTGAAAVLEQSLHALRSKIRCAFIYGSVARGNEEAGSDIDLMVIGDVTVSDLLPGLRRAERTLGRQINPTVYPANELARKFKQGHHFIQSVLKDPAKNFIIGTQRDLEAVARPKSNQKASDEQSRNRRVARRGRSKA
jgi:uncharacterized protein